MEAEVIVNKKSQQGRIINFLEEHGEITVRQAFSLGINSPTKRISELIEKGIMKVKQDVKVYDTMDDGRKVQRSHYKVYILA